MSFWDELRKRKVIQWALGYTAFALAVADILNATQTPFGLSNPLVRVIMVVVVAGFGLVVVLAWFHGERGRQRVTALEVMLLLGVLAVGGLAASLAWRPESEDQAASAGESTDTTLAATLPRLTPQRNSIAVLPFTNLSGDTADDYFSDGITEELTNTLGELPGLQVVARTSAFQFKGRNLDLREVGQKLGVAALLEGSVQHSGTQVRIIARLVDAARGYVLWSGQVDADARNVFAAEDSISRAVANALQVKLALATVPTENAPAADPVAHQTYLKARSLSTQDNADSVREAGQKYHEAVRRDPRLAPAWAGLGRSYINMGQFGFLPMRSARDSASWAAQRALRVDSSSAEAHYVMALAATDLGRRIRELQRALHFNPSLMEARRALAEAYAASGNDRAAFEEARSAARLDPLSRHTWDEMQRIALAVGHDSLAGFPRSPQAPPGVPAPAPGAGFSPPSFRPGSIQAELCAQFAADPTLAASAPHHCSAALQRAGKDPAVLSLVALGYARLERRAEALAVLQSYDSLAAGDSTKTVNEAAVHAALGDADSAFALLQGESPAQLRRELEDPRLGPLRRDPRFSELQRKAAGG